MDRRNRWPRAAWFRSEIPPALTPAARRRLIEINKGFDTDSRLDELDRELVEVVVEPSRLDASTSIRRRELAELDALIRRLRRALTTLHPRSRDAITGTLASWRWRPDFRREIVKALETLRRAAVEVREAIPGAGGNPGQARRDAVICAVVAWLGSLEPTRARAGLRAALTRNAVRDPLHIPLRGPREDLERRQIESVKVVCAVLGLRLKGDVANIIARALRKELA